MTLLSKKGCITVTVPAFRSDEFSDAALNVLKLNICWLIKRKCNCSGYSLSGADAENAYLTLMYTAMVTVLFLEVKE